MRTRRLKAGPERAAVYHCITRTVNGAFLFEDADKEVLRRQLWQAAEFSGVEVLTYCLLANHFHVLVRVPEHAPISDSELLRRYRLLYPRDAVFTRKHAGGVFAESAATVKKILAGGGPEAVQLRSALTRRMGDLSEFMKTVKQRFSVWYNRTYQRYGTLWAERFKSVLVEEERYALATVAAYIDLNPVRAGLCEDPKDYRFCGYGEAVGEGSRRVRQGLRRVLGGGDWNTILREYRLILFGKGATAKRDASGPAAAIPWTEARKVLDAGGRLPLATLLRCRVRYFSDGAALGSAPFVAEILRRYQQATGRRGRQKEPHRLQGGDDAWGNLTTLRGLRRSVFG